MNALAHQFPNLGRLPAGEFLQCTVCGTVKHADGSNKACPGAMRDLAAESERAALNRELAKTLARIDHAAETEAEYLKNLPF